MNELIENKSWIKRNWKWFLPASSFCLIVLGVFFSSGLSNNVADITKAYSDNSIYENAMLQVKSNERINELLGDIEPIDNMAILEGAVEYSNNNSTINTTIDNMAILEGAVEYSNNNSTINTTIRIKGSKGNGKMDIEADKVNDEWKYKLVNIRIKEPKETIEIINTEH